MKIINLIILFLLFSGCQDPKKETKSNMHIIELHDIKEVRSLKLSDLGFSDIGYVPLETTENDVISDIEDIKLDNDFFLIKDYNKIYKFRKNGAFITRIGKEGRGPSEFTVAHDIDIDQRNQTVYLVSGWQKKFNVYSGQGELLRTFHCPQNTTSFRLTGDGILCYNSNITGNVQTSYNLIDTSGRDIIDFPNKYNWTKTQTSAIIDENLFYKYDNKLYKKEAYSDTIYMFDNKCFKPHFVISHGDKLLTKEVRSKYGPEYLFEKYITQKRIFEFGDYVYYEFMYDFKIGHQNILRGLIGSTRNSFQVIIDAGEGLINDLDGGVNVRPITVFNDGTLICWVNANELKNYVESEVFKNSSPKYPEKKKELRQFAAKLKETDNPVLMFVQMKK